MKFSKIIGKCDPKIIHQAQEKLSSIFAELSLSFDNRTLGSQLGGDALLFQLIYPVPHICDASSIEFKDLEKDLDKKLKESEEKEEDNNFPEEIRKFKEAMKGKLLTTAATDGKRFYWNPEFINSKSRIGLRILLSHEAWHAIYMHPSRRGSRIPRLWNIAVDYKVNYTTMEDLKARGQREVVIIFKEHLGDFIFLKEYADFLKDPFNPPKRLAHLNPIHSLKAMADPAYKDPGDKSPPMYFAEPELSADMKKPENIYDYLFSQIPKCPECGKVGMYKKPEEYKKLQKQIEENKKKEQKKSKEKQKEDQKANQSGGQQGQQGEEEGGQCCGNLGNSGDCCGGNEGQGQGQGQSNQQENKDCCGGCGTCDKDDNEYINPFGAGDLVDEHLNTDVSEEELGKRISDAMEGARKMAGRIPAGLEDELGQLIAPKLTWQDFLRARILKKRKGLGKTDWLSPKSRPMFAGLYTPKKRDYFVNILCAYDCSGSMSTNDIAFGISQLQALDNKCSPFLVPWDTLSYWKDMIQIKKTDKDNLKNAKVKGRGGTNCKSVFEEYEEHCGELDIIVIITDGYLYDNELKGVNIKKGVDVIWLITSHNPSFKPPFGRVFNLHNE